MKIINYLLTVIAVCIYCTSNAKVNIHSLREQNTEQMLLDQFIGSGVEISNATFNGNSIIPIGEGRQITSFENEGDCDILEIKKGIMLSTSGANNIVSGNEDYLLSGLNFTSEELYDFANNYLPKLYQELLEDKYTLFTHYASYVDHLEAPYNPITYTDMTLEEYENLIDFFETDLDNTFLGAANYYYWSSAYIKENNKDYSYFTTENGYEDLYPVFAVYEVVRSWEPKYYTVSAAELERAKIYETNFFLQTAFRINYVNSTPAPYDRSKKALYEKMNDYYFYSSFSNRRSDKDLHDLVSTPVYSPAIIEFDFTTTDDSVAFNYSFGSEEYPDYIDSKYNDVFAFIITDLTTGIQENLAKLPQTNEIVSINNVNDKKNRQFFIENYSCKKLICDCNVDLWGMTTTLTAKTEVVPCRKYHLKIAIANVSDYKLPSAVFLEAGSFKSNGVSSKTRYTRVNSRGIVKDCSNGEIVLSTKKKRTPTTININYLGEAQNGVHYKELPKQVVIPANTDSVVLELVPLEIEKDSMEIVIVIETETSCSQTEGDTIRTFIYNNQPITITPNEPECCATELSVEHTGFIKTIRWEPANLLKGNDTYLVHTQSCPDEDVVFKVTAENIFGCQKVEKEITLKPCPFDLGFTLGMVTDNKSQVLINNCNNGKLVFKVTRDAKNKDAAEFILTYNDDIDINGLKQQITIPIEKQVFELPISALKKSAPYHSENEITVGCRNCTVEPKEITIKVQSRQEEPLVLEEKVYYEDCDFAGMDIEVPLLSGTPAVVDWQPIYNLTNVNQLSATLEKNIYSSKIYTVTATDSTGCFTSSSKISLVKNNCIELDIPSFFTPNNDGVNEVWRISGLEDTENSNVKIYDRWGKILYEFNPNSEGWDGTYNGAPCPSTDYWYKIDCEEYDKVYTGHFTLIRE